MERGMEGAQPEHAPPSAGKTQEHARRLFFAGVTATLAYIVALGIYAFRVRWAMLNMEPDEFATFLSGVFAPLAFLWLVLGFRQQGDELQNSARALWLQGEELRNSVEQQRQLVEVSREQLASELADRLRAEEDAERAAQPRLLMPGIGGSYSGPRRSLKLMVTSGGPTCSDVQMIVDGEVVTRAPILGEGERLQTERRYEAPEHVQPVTVAVEYTDTRGHKRRQKFYIPIAEHGGPNRDRTLGEPVRLGGVEKCDPSSTS